MAFENTNFQCEDRLNTQTRTHTHTHTHIYIYTRARTYRSNSQSPPLATVEMLVGVNAKVLVANCGVSIEIVTDGDGRCHLLSACVEGKAGGD